MEEQDNDCPLPFPIEFIVHGTARSLQAKSASKETWKEKVEVAARLRIEKISEFYYLDDRALSATIYYFPFAKMQGDVDNIVKPILDAMYPIIYPDDSVIERVTVQKIEPDVIVDFGLLTEVLEEALRAEGPVVYIRVDDDKSWRKVS